MRTRLTKIYPDFKTFSKYAKKGNLVPVYAELLADLETPVSSFYKICDSDYAYLLESVESQEKIGRYSFLSSNPLLVIKSKDRQIEIIKFKPSYNCEEVLNVFTKNPVDFGIIFCSAVARYWISRVDISLNTHPIDYCITYLSVSKAIR